MSKVEFKKIRDEIYGIVRNVPIYRIVYSKMDRTPTFEALNNSVPDWDLTPIVWDHPVDKLGSPRELNENETSHETIGFLINSKLKNNKLYADLALASDKIRHFDDLKDLIEMGRKLNVSVGYSGILNENNSYESITPDHLALLVDTEAVCMPEDGCGINVHGILTANKGEKTMEVKKKKKIEHHDDGDDMEVEAVRQHTPRDPVEEGLSAFAEMCSNATEEVHRRIRPHLKKLKHIPEKVEALEAMADRLAAIENYVNEQKKKAEPVYHNLPEINLKERLFRN